MTDRNFFEDVRPAAVLKHGILRRYLHIFASKTGSTSIGGRVAYLDGYAGPGVYESGAPGSPALASQTADTLADIRNLEGYYVEANEENYEELCRNLAGADAAIHRGTIEEHLGDILERIGDAPLFAFFDPFGLGIPFDTLVHNVVHRQGKNLQRPTTEVLLNFSLSGLRRNAGHLNSASTHGPYLKARDKLLARVDSTLGGDWWRELWKDENPDREALIFARYLRELRVAAEDFGYLAIPVANRWEGPTVYHLILLSSYAGGFWAFNQAVSGAMEEYRAYCHESSGQMDLEPLPVREERWTTHIAENIANLMASGAAPFRVGAKMIDVYGETLGEAREKHVRAAIKGLHSGGSTPTTGVGDVESMIIEPP